MKTGVLSDQTLLKDRFELFKSLLDELDVDFLDKVRPFGENGVEVVGCRITFDSGLSPMQREERLSFDEEAHWNKIKQICDQFGFQLK